MQMLLAALSRRMSCSRARMVMTKARLPSRSVVIPTSRPGIWRTSASVEARMPEIRAAVLRGDAERLALAGRDVGAVRAGRREDGQADRLDDRDEQGAGGMRQPADLGHRLEQAEEVGLGGDDPGDRPVRVGQHPLERGEVGRAGGLAVGDERDLLELEAAREVGPRRLPVVRMDAARDEDALAPGRPAGHQRGLGRGRRAVVVRRRDDVEVDQLGQQRLVLVDALEGALADLGLVRRVGRVPLAAQEELVDRRRAPVAVDARARGTRRGRSGCARPGRCSRAASSSSGSGSGRSSGEARSSAGMSSKSWSTDVRPSAASIRSRSSAVWGPYGIAAVSRPR